MKPWDSDFSWIIHRLEYLLVAAIRNSENTMTASPINDWKFRLNVKEPDSTSTNLFEPHSYPDDTREQGYVSTPFHIAVSVEGEKEMCFFGAARRKCDKLQKTITTSARREIQGRVPHLIQPNIQVIERFFGGEICMYHMSPDEFSAHNTLNDQVKLPLEQRVD